MNAISKILDILFFAGIIFIMSSISTPPKPVEIVKTQYEEVYFPVYLSESTPHSHPLPGYKPGSKFGWRTRPIKGFHPGIDIGAPTGTPILASGNGFISRVQFKSTGYGNNVIVKHDKTYSTLYAHMSKVVARVGSYVETGDTIGYVGSTGLSTCPHLHFEVILNNVKVNPENYIQW